MKDKDYESPLKRIKSMNAVGLPSLILESEIESTSNEQVKQMVNNLAKYVANSSVSKLVQTLTEIVKKYVDNEYSELMANRKLLFFFTPSQVIADSKSKLLRLYNEIIKAIHLDCDNNLRSHLTNLQNEKFISSVEWNLKSKIEHTDKSVSNGTLKLNTLDFHTVIIDLHTKIDQLEIEIAELRRLVPLMP